MSGIALGIWWVLTCFAILLGCIGIHALETWHNIRKSRKEGWKW